MVHLISTTIRNWAPVGLLMYEQSIAMGAFLLKKSEFVHIWYVPKSDELA